MNCVEWEDRVALHAGGDLAGADAAEVERHLGECSACQSLWSDVRESLAVLQAAHAEVAGGGALHCRAQSCDGRTGTQRAALAQAGLDLRRRRGGGIAADVRAVAVAARGSPGSAHTGVDSPGARSGEPRRRSPARPAGSARTARPRTPLTVKLQTTDPNIVIYWIAD